MEWNLPVKQKQMPVFWFGHWVQKLIICTAPVITHLGFLHQIHHAQLRTTVVPGAFYKAVNSWDGWMDGFDKLWSQAPFVGQKYLKDAKLIILCHLPAAIQQHLCLARMGRGTTASDPGRAPSPSLDSLRLGFPPASALWSPGDSILHILQSGPVGQVLWWIPHFSAWGRVSRQERGLLQGAEVWSWCLGVPVS